jgi:hypothetical protein
MAPTREGFRSYWHAEALGGVFHEAIAVGRKARKR